LRPETTIIQGTGDLYWNLGMRLAWTQALKMETDFFLWLNDDLVLEPRSIDRLVDLWLARRVEKKDRLIIVGRTVSEKTGSTTYGGYLRTSKWSRLRFRRRVDGDLEECDAMNGNCVLFPRIAAEEVGVNSPFYTHSMGDMDYGLRARRKGYSIIEHPTPVGFQEENIAWANSVSHLGRDNWRYILTSPKGIRLGEWLHFCRQHGGLLWPFNFVIRYVKLVSSIDTRVCVLSPKSQHGEQNAPNK
jgi:GT2 family glycosyltransferase